MAWSWLHIPDHSAPELSKELGDACWCRVNEMPSRESCCFYTDVPPFAISYLGTVGTQYGCYHDPGGGLYQDQRILPNCTNDFGGNARSCKVSGNKNSRLICAQQCHALGKTNGIAWVPLPPSPEWRRLSTAIPEVSCRSGTSIPSALPGSRVGSGDCFPVLLRCFGYFSTLLRGVLLRLPLTVRLHGPVIGTLPDVPLTLLFQHPPIAVTFPPQPIRTVT